MLLHASFRPQKGPEAPEINTLQAELSFDRALPIRTSFQYLIPSLVSFSCKISCCLLASLCGAIYYLYTIQAMSTPPTSPIAQEHDVPILISLEPKRHRLGPIDDTIEYDVPFHVRMEGNPHDWEWYPILPCTMEQALAGFVAKMDREIQNMRDAAGEITGLLELDTVHQLETRVDTLEATNEVAIARIVQLETQLEAALEAEDAQDTESEEEGPADEEDAQSMSGRGGRHGGRGIINMTAAELTSLINDSVVEALAAHNVAGKFDIH
ncbi:hypothetical protein L1987_01539 [Smallanthus sonchifolius]|uniref:Uncharacterized protein n=1 Tax=Smallanthus sonchifolius TaxID=185202 RepID=A0ACB9K5B5_9ASTR|nr:hypothetical protein L1987_01539 [Smallanthus sonchifolius]